MSVGMSWKILASGYEDEIPIIPQAAALAVDLVVSQAGERVLAPPGRRKRRRPPASRPTGALSVAPRCERPNAGSRPRAPYVDHRPARRVRQALRRLSSPTLPITST